MNWFFSAIVSFFSELLPFIKPSNRKGFLSMLLILSSNALPVIGVIAFNWNPFVILIIYWCESAIIGFFNLLKMFIGGFIQDGRFSTSGAIEAVLIGLFFCFHYGMFMLVHGVFIVVMFVIAGTDSSGSGLTDIDKMLSVINVFVPSQWTLRGFMESELFAIAALFVSHLVYFYLYFIHTKEYNTAQASDFMLRPYKRIVVMHMTILIGFAVVMITGSRGAFIMIVWVTMKVVADFKIILSELAPKKGPAQGVFSEEKLREFAGKLKNSRGYKG